MSSPNSHPALPFVAFARDLRRPSVHSEQKSEPPGIRFYESTRCEVQHDANYPFSSTNANNVFTQFPSRSTMRCSCTTLIIHSLLQMRTMSSPNSHPALPFVAPTRR
ncbi:hypothetical protein CEXT_578811 [Caerostris extrusa]|uniref:Uncharacterized protein n=1 Tax=Caerostris extrusa TaxID=172846 RepID=A0AAV4R089_CAEEX|nr:hypothetical protein CEXT_578811 [Caerostris extrusa]